MAWTSWCVIQNFILIWNLKPDSKNMFHVWFYHVLSCYILPAKYFAVSFLLKLMFSQYILLDQLWVKYFIHLCISTFPILVGHLIPQFLLLVKIFSIPSHWGNQLMHSQVDDLNFTIHDFWSKSFPKQTFLSMTSIIMHQSSAAVQNASHIHELHTFLPINQAVLSKG